MLGRMKKRDFWRTSLVCTFLFSLLILPGCGRTEKETETKPTETKAIDSTSVKSENLTDFSQEITSSVKQLQIKTGTTYSLPVTVKNTGKESWFRGKGAVVVDLGYRWSDSKGKPLPIEGNRASLNPAVLEPGQSTRLLLPVGAPTAPGSYILKLSMVQEGNAWFFMKGGNSLLIPCTID